MEEGRKEGRGQKPEAGYLYGENFFLPDMLCLSGCLVFHTSPQSQFLSPDLLFVSDLISTIKARIASTRAVLSLFTVQGRLFSFSIMP